MNIHSNDGIILSLSSMERYLRTNQLQQYEKCTYSKQQVIKLSMGYAGC